MYAIAPDDKLWMIERDHADRRARADAERMTKATAEQRVPRSSAEHELRRVGGSRPLASAAHLLHALTAMRPAFHGRTGR